MNLHLHGLLEKCVRISWVGSMVFGVLIFNAAPGYSNPTFFGSFFEASKYYAADYDGLDIELTDMSPYLVGAKADHQLVHVTSDAMPGFLDVKVTTDQDANAIGIAYVDSSGSREEFKLDQFSRGIVIYKKSGKDVVTLKSPNFNPGSGGNIDLVYLKNGVTGSAGTFHMELVRVGSE